ILELYLFVPRLVRPFSAASRIFSTCVPSKMCSGFTHRVLSQVWQPFLSLGRGFPCKAQVTLCPRYFRPFQLTIAYPLSLIGPIQSQQPDSGSTSIRCSR